MLYIHILYFLVGLALLLKGSDFFVEASASIAKRFGISEFVIGLTLVACGTSIPELASSIVASLEKYSEIIIGNVVGSNIANIGLIIGLCAIISEIKSNEDSLRRDGYMMLFVGILFYIFALNGIVSVVESGVLLLLYLAYICFLLKSKPAKRKAHFREFIEYFTKIRYLITLKDLAFGVLRKKSGGVNLLEANIRERYRKALRHGFIRDFFIIIISIFAIVYGAEFLVNEAVWFANYFQIPTNIIAFSVIAIGTSMPELGISLSSARKGFGDILLGNLLGSNIVNILLVIGISAFISPIDINRIALVYTIPFMIFISALLLFFIKSHWRIRTCEGVVLLSSYILFITFVLLSGIWK